MTIPRDQIAAVNTAHAPRVMLEQIRIMLADISDPDDILDYDCGQRHALIAMMDFIYENMNVDACRICGDQDCAADIRRDKCCLCLSDWGTCDCTK